MTAAYGCCGQALTRFTGHPCTGPGRRSERRGSGEGRLEQVLPQVQSILAGAAAPGGGLGPYTCSVPPLEPNLHPAEAAQRQRALLLKLVRVAFFVVIATFISLAFLQHQADASAGVVALKWWAPPVVAVFLFAVALSID